VSPLDLRLSCGNRRINNDAPMRLQCLQRRDLVHTFIKRLYPATFVARIATRRRVLIRATALSEVPQLAASRLIARRGRSTKRL
jgi:hypothetical protein